MKLATLISYLFFLTSVSSAAPTYQIPSPQVSTLPNGMTVAFFEDAKIPLLDLVLIVEGGTAKDPAGKSGISQLIATLIDRALEKSEEFAATRSVSADDDSISIHLHGLSSDTDSIIALVKSVFDQASQGKPFSADIFEREKKHLADSMSSLVDQPDTLGALASQRLFFAGTEYERGPFRTRSEFLSITNADLTDALKRSFQAKNLTLLVIGKGNDSTLKSKIAAAFSAKLTVTEAASSSKAKTKSNSNLAAWQKADVLLVDRPGMNQAHVELAADVPSLKDADHSALLVANTILGEMFSSRLNREMRDKLGLTYSINSHFAIRKSNSKWIIGTATRNGELGRFIGTLKEQLARFETGQVSEAEVSQAKEFLLGGFPIATSTLYAAASRWMTGKTFAMPENYLNAFQPEIAPISQAQVSAAIKKHFKAKKFKLMVVGDAKRVAPELKKANLVFQTISAKNLL